LSRISSPPHANQPEFFLPKKSINIPAWACGASANVEAH
jgi:hypothetical protein